MEVFLDLTVWASSTHNLGCRPDLIVVLAEAGAENQENGGSVCRARRLANKTVFSDAAETTH